MTTVVEQPPATAPRPRRRGPMLVGLVVVVVLAVGGWFAASAWTTQQVSTRAEVARCTGSPVKATPRGPTVLLSPGMRCFLRVTVRNDSRWPVTLDEAGLAISGPGAEGPVRMVQAAPGGSQIGEHGIDAHFRLSGRVEPGASRVVTVVVEERLRTCNSAGAWVMPWPSVRVSVHGVHRTVEAPSGWRVGLPDRGNLDGTVCPDEL